STATRRCWRRTSRDWRRTRAICPGWRASGRSSSAESTPKPTGASRPSAPPRRSRCAARRPWLRASSPIGCSGRRAPGPPREALAQRGAHVQRPLWASTSTKNPAYSDTLYVDNLIGPDTVNTMPDATIEAFSEHGTLARTVDKHVEDADAVWSSLHEVGVDMADVAETLEDEGVASFEKSFDELISALETKATSLRSE